MRNYFSFFFAFLLFLLITGWVNGQDVFDREASKYYLQKNKAELAIMNGQYDIALVAYKVAFRAKFPNERDIYNAFHVAFIVRDSSAAKEYLDIIFLHGQQKEKYELTPFGSLIATEDFYKWCSRSYDSLYKIAQNSKMPLLAAILDTIFVRDQSLRKEVKDKMRNGEKVDLRTTDSLNLVEIEKFIERYGFPNYELLGIFEQCKGGYPGAFSTIDLLLWHTRHSFRILNRRLTEASLSGLLPPEEYTFYMDAQQDKESYYSILPRDGQSGAVSLDSLKGLENIDDRRRSVMACKLSDYVSKFHHQEREKDGRKQFFFLPLFARFTNSLPPGANF